MYSLKIIANNGRILAELSEASNGARYGGGKSCIIGAPRTSFLYSSWLFFARVHKLRWIFFWNLWEILEWNASVMNLNRHYRFDTQKWHFSGKFGSTYSNIIGLALYISHQSIKINNSTKLKYHLNILMPTVYETVCLIHLIPVRIDMTPIQNGIKSGIID